MMSMRVSRQRVQQGEVYSGRIPLTPLVYIWGKQRQLMKRKRGAARLVRRRIGYTNNNVPQWKRLNRHIISLKVLLVLCWQMRIISRGCRFVKSKQRRKAGMMNNIKLSWSLKAYTKAIMHRAASHMQVKQIVTKEQCLGLSCSSYTFLRILIIEVNPEKATANSNAANIMICNKLFCLSSTNNEKLLPSSYTSTSVLSTPRSVSEKDKPALSNFASPPPTLSRICCRVYQADAPSVTFRKYLSVSFSRAETKLASSRYRAKARTPRSTYSPLKTLNSSLYRVAPLKLTTWLALIQNFPCPSERMLPPSLPSLPCQLPWQISQNSNTETTSFSESSSLPVRSLFLSTIWLLAQFLEYLEVRVRKRQMHIMTKIFLLLLLLP